MFKRKQSLPITISNLGLICIGIFSLGYYIFQRNFAELHIALPFLDFPIFVGEILFFLCLLLLLAYWINTHKKFNKWHYILFLYCGFVIAKALYGYAEWGPLAFRHAALFYYPLFAVFGCTFYRRDFFDNKKILCIVLLFIFVIVF